MPLLHLFPRFCIQRHAHGIATANGEALGGICPPPTTAMASSGSNDGSNQRKGSLSSNLDAVVPREKLPARLQKLVDDDETLLDQIYDGT